MPAVPNSVPTAVVSSTANSVQVLDKPQLKPYRPMTGSGYAPVVPTPDNLSEETAAPNPVFGHAASTGHNFTAGSEGAPTVPDMNGVLFRKGPIDSHYVSESEVRSPVAKVNNPPTRGMQTWVKSFVNHIAQSPQNVDPNGFRVMPGQQRTSFMRITTPPHGMGYAPEFFEPRQQPQRDRTYQYGPSTGTGPFGAGTPKRFSRSVLNSRQFGAGQTAGGIGGNNYTPAPGPPPTTSTAGSPGDGSGMPVWG